MYIRLHEMLDVINTLPVKLFINGEIKVIVNRSAIDKIYLNYEVIKVSVSNESIIMIQAKKYERTTDENYTFEMGV